MNRTIWAVTAAKMVGNLGVDDWLTLSDFEKSEVLASYMRAVMPGFLSRRFEYRVTATGISTEDGRELFVLETGWPEEF